MFSISSISLLKWWDLTQVDTGESTGPLHGVWGSTKDDIFVVGMGEGIPTGINRFLVSGGIFRYDGHTWSQMSSLDDEIFHGIILNAVWGSSSRDVYAVGSNWTILHYDGIEWGQIDSGIFTGTEIDRSPAHGFWSVWGNSADNIYAVGSSTTRGGLALHFDGDSWRKVALPETHRDHYHCVWGTSAENVFILGNLGRIYHYDGSAWEEMNIGEPINLRTIWGTSNNDVFTAGYGGKIFHYDGAEWIEMFELKDMVFSGIWGGSGKNVYAAGTRSIGDGVIYHYSGKKWKKIKTVSGGHLNGIWVHGDGDVFAIGSSNLILHYSGISIFTLSLGFLAFGLGIFGWRNIRNKKRGASFVHRPLRIKRNAAKNITLS